MIEQGLYVVATPIGNLKDITYRAIETLTEVDFIAAEDTRHAKTLLSHYEIRTPLTSYHAHSSERKEEEIISRVLDGASCALISEAGTPGISDPGVRLISKAHEAGVPVIPIPGASAFVTLLSASGLPTNNVLFAGFLSSKSGTRKNQLIRFRDEEKKVIVIYESVHRIMKTLTAIDEVFEGEVLVVLGKELTKKFETIVRKKVKEVLAFFENDSMMVKGEYVLILDNRA